MNSPSLTLETDVVSAQVRRARRSSVSALIGGTLEYYDFYVYALAAALVFPTLMFPPSGGTLTGVLLSFATLGVGYVARPLGAVVFGHLGDKFGRKRTLMATIVLMGVATLLIGFLPTFHDIGPAATVLLVILRLAQGFSAGAETTGASTLTLESAPAGHRAFYTQFTQGGNYAGFVLANLVFLPIASLPKEDLLSWGWRIPFLLSVVVVVVAIFLRRRLEEPEIFVEEVKVSGHKAKLPIATAFSRSPWGIIKVLMLTTGAAFNTLVFAFGLSFATRPEFGIQIASTTMIWACILGNAFGIFSQVFWGALADRVGRRPLIVCGALGSAAMTPFVFGSIASGNVPMIFVSVILANCLAYTAYSATFQVFGGEMFPVEVRFTATSIGFAAGVVLVGFVPTIAASLITRDNWIAAPIIVLTTAVLTSVAALCSRETAAVPLEKLGAPAKSA